MKLHLIYIGIAVLFFGCRKNEKACWQGFNPQGTDVIGLVLCDKTKAEAEAAYPQYWFYKSDEPKYCWKVEFNGQTFYARNIPQSMANRMVQQNRAYRFTRFDCNSYCSVRWAQKHKSKITGQFGPTYSIVENIYSSDSCGRLSVGRVIVYRETTDSLITRELLEKNF